MDHIHRPLALIVLALGGCYTISNPSVDTFISNLGRLRYQELEPNDLYSSKNFQLIECVKLHSLDSPSDRLESTEALTRWFTSHGGGSTKLRVWAEAVLSGDLNASFHDEYSNSELAELRIAYDEGLRSWSGGSYPFRMSERGSLHEGRVITFAPRSSPLILKALETRILSEGDPPILEALLRVADSFLRDSTRLAAVTSKRYMNERNPDLSFELLARLARSDSPGAFESVVMPRFSEAASEGNAKVLRFLLGVFGSDALDDNFESLIGVAEREKLWTELTRLRRSPDVVVAARAAVVLLQRRGDLRVLGDLLDSLNADSRGFTLERQVKDQESWKDCKQGLQRQLLDTLRTYLGEHLHRAGIAIPTCEEHADTFVQKARGWLESHKEQLRFGGKDRPLRMIEE